MNIPCLFITYRYIIETNNIITNKGCGTVIVEKVDLNNNEIDNIVKIHIQNELQQQELNTVTIIAKNVKKRQIYKVEKKKSMLYDICIYMGVFISGTIVGIFISKNDQFQMHDV